MKERLENAKPLRLYLKDGTWRLSYLALLRVSDVVFKPTTYEVEGPKSILSVLKRIGGQERLAAETEQLIRQFTGEDSAEECYEPEDQSWIPADPSPKPSPRTATEEGADASPGVSGRLLRTLEARVARLEKLERRLSQFDELDRRLTHIETLLKKVSAHRASRQAAGADGTASNVPPAQAGTASRPAPDQPLPAEPAPEPAPFDPTDDEEQVPEGLQVPPTMVTASQPRPAASPESSLPGSPTGSKPAPGGVDRPGPGSLPSAKGFLTVLRMLVGENASLVEVPPEHATSFEGGADGWYVAHLYDDHDEVVGAMLTDLTAAVHVGGSLLMMPPAVRDEQLTAGQASRDVVEALSEVFNNLTSVINDEGFGVHVRSSLAEPLDLSLHPWIAEPQNQLEMREGNGGRIVVVLL